MDARRTRLPLVSALLVAGLTAAACGKTVPTREEAGRLIAASASFTTEAVTRTAGLYPGRCILRQFDPDAEENRRYQRLAQAGQQLGWMRVGRRAGTSRECGILASMSDVLLISLTPEGVRQQGNWPSRPVGDTYSEFAERAPAWNLPLQRREFVAVTGIADPNPGNGEVSVEFEWRVVWPMGGTPDAKRGTAMFRKYDTGWRVERIDGL